MDKFVGWRVIAGLFCVVPGLAGAVAVTAATGELVTIRSCTVVVDDHCEAMTISTLERVTGGRPGDTVSAASVALAGYGSAEGSVALSGTIGAPVVRASAVAEPGARTNTNSVALQRYTYTGSADSLRSFGGELTYAQHTTGPHGIGIGDGIFTFIDVFLLAVDAIEAGETLESNFGAMVSVERMPGFMLLGRSSFSDSLSTESGLANLSVDVLLHPGDTVWVRAFVQTPAAHGAWIDATHTLRTAWSDATGLVPGAVALPAPATVPMLALAGLIAASCRRRSGRSR